jgi:hypothetical protein
MTFAGDDRFLVDYLQAVLLSACSRRWCRS